MSNLKVEGKVGDFCLNCKNCKAVTRIHDGKNASIRIIEVDCEDPYDGMAKTLDADSDICCSMFEPNSPCDKISLLQHELEMDRLRRTIHQLEKEKAAHMKGIERLKKSQEKLQNQVKNLQEWREKCISRGNDIDHLLSENKEKDKKIGELESCKEECEKKYRYEISKLQNIVAEKEVEIRGLWKDNVYLNQNRLFGDEAMKKNTKQRQEIDNLRSKLISLNTINKGLAEDRKKLINYIRSLKIASENYLKEFTYEED